MTPTNSSRSVYTSNAWRKEQQKNGIYVPKYWLEADFVDPSITYFVIELSVPKLLFGTSAREPRNEHRELAVQKIQEFCLTIGIRLFKQQIFGMIPSAVSFGKNIDITSLATCEQAITVLSRFNDRFRSDIYTYRPAKGGSELYFNSKSSTFKVYDKLKEIENNAITPEEQGIVDASKSSGQKPIWICETLRTELTLKDTGSIKKRLKPYMKDPPTFGNIFRDDIWADLVKNEVERVFNHPLADFVFLSTLQANVIQKLLDRHIKNPTTKLWVRDMIEKIQRFGGTKGVKRYYLEAFKSRQTYYNHLKASKKIIKNVSLPELENLTASKFHSFYLGQFGIENTIQDTLF